MRIKKRPSIRAVASVANVSPTVVSAVLNGRSKNVRYGEDVAKRVREAADTMGYIPNKLTSAIINKTPLTIGVLSPWPDHEKYGKIIRYLSEKLRQKGYHMLVEVCDFEPENFLQHFRDMVSLQTGGVIVLPYATSLIDEESMLDVANKCKAMSPATIVVDWYWHEPLFDCVNVDERSLISMPLRHLLENGHRDIVCLGAASPKRLEYVRDVLGEFGLESRLDYFTSGLAQIYKQDYEEGQVLAKAALELNPRPTALMCVQDRIAVGAYKVCELAGLNIGKDIALTGGDNMAMTQQVTVPITTMDIQVERFADKLVDMLMAKMAGDIEAKPKLCEIEPVLIVRESSDFKVNF